MATKIDWESQIGRRLRFRDLHVLSTVVQCGSMAKAAAQLGVSQPSVSEVIADLEHALRVRLLDRSPQGIGPTIYANALLKRSRVAFDELKQGIRDIEFLSDPTVGELWIGCPESISSSILPAIIQRMSQQYPRVVPNVDAGTTDMMLRNLLDRSLDLVVARGGQTLAADSVIDRLNVEVLFDDELVVATGTQSRWARRRKIDLAELADAPWILTPAESWNEKILAEAFRARGLDMPKAFLTTFSIHLRANLLAAGTFITTLPSSVLRFNAERFSLRVLPVELPVPAWPFGIMCLKNRPISPAVQLFIDCAREVVKPLGKRAP